MSAGPDDLCTIADLKAWLPNQGNNDDVALQSLVTNGSMQVLRYLNRPHILASVIGALNEFYDGNDSDRLLPRYFPIAGVTSVMVDGVAVPSAASATASGFLFDSRRVLLRGFAFTRRLPNM